MNELERRMVEQLQDLRENHHVIGVKAEFEAEGTRLEEAIRLKEVISAAGLGLTLKVGGCEALRDMYEARVIGVDRVVGPMVESPWALHKFVLPVKMAFPEDERDQVQFCVNVETSTGADNFEAHARRCRMRRAATASFSAGWTCLGRMGLTREDVNSDAVYEVAESALPQADAARSRVRAGRRRLRRVPRRSCGGCPAGYLDRYETRKVIFACPAALGDDADDGYPQGGRLRAHVAQEQAGLLRLHLRGGPRADRHAPGTLRRLISQAGGMYE